MPWNTIECHDNVRKIILQAISRGLYAQTSLIYGPTGAGQIQTARAVVKTLVCTEREADFCGECSSCKRIDGRQYPDVIELFPWEDWAKPERNKPTQDYSVGHLRLMMEQAAIMPYEGEKKIFLIHHADRMNDSSANSLLKVLEEPYEYVMFILVTDSFSRMLETVVSRCWKVRLPPMDMDSLVERLKPDFPDDQAETIARAAGGLPERARELIDNGFLERRDMVLECIKRIRSREMNCGKVSEEFQKKIVDKQEALSILLGIVRDAILLSEGLANSGLSHPDRREEISNLWPTCSSEQLLIGASSVVSALEGLERNAMPSLLYYDLFLSLSRL